MGLDLGFQQHGFETRVALDNDPAVEATLRANNLKLPVISRDIGDVSAEEILQTAGLSQGEPNVLTGAPPCEPFTTAGARNGFSGPSRKRGIRIYRCN